MRRLIPIENDVHDISRRVREYDPALRVFYNRRYKRFEVHDLRAKGGTFVMAADKLDARLLRRLRAASLENRTASDILRDLEEEERRRERMQQARVKDIAMGMADDLRFAGNVVSGYGGSG